MVIDMNDANLTMPAQLKTILDGRAAVDFRPAGEDRARYAHIAAVQGRFCYRRLSRTDSGLVRRYLMHTTGYSRAQLARLVKHTAKGGAPSVKRYCSMFMWAVHCMSICLAYYA